MEHIEDKELKDEIIRGVLFNPNGDDSKKSLIGANTTNILDLANIYKQGYINLFKTSYSNNWIPEKVSNMEVDKVQYETVLDDDTKEALNTFICYLLFMDSLQTNNLPNIGKFLTLAEAKLMLTRQTLDEAIHSYSYAYILLNLMTEEEFTEIIYKWRIDPILLKRISEIANIYEEYKDRSDNKAFLVLLIANYLLEGVYFYPAFMFFHNLSYRSLMNGTNVQIAYIKRDELVHCAYFKAMIKEFKEENPEDYDEELIYKMFNSAVETDLEFTSSVLGDKILGITNQTTQDYTYYNANVRLKDIGLVEVFPKSENPYKHLDMLAGIEDESTNKTNSFERTSINYKQPEILKGWDKFNKFTNGEVQNEVYDRYPGSKSV